MNAFETVALIGGLGTGELVLIFLVILLLFGARRLPELAKGLGKSMREFKKAAQDVQDDFSQAMDAADPNKPLPPAQRPTAAAPKAPSAPTGQPDPAAPQAQA